MYRTILAAVTLGVVTLAALAVWWSQPSSAQPKLPAASPAVPAANGKHPTTPLPIAQVILFNSGVGYFQREGEVEGNARVDLTFPSTDINDLLKSLVLQGSGGKVSTINYDSPDPIEKTLKSFALDLTTNPSFGQLLNQARGEKVEVTVQAAGGGQPQTLNGTILGMEAQRQPHGKDAVIEVELLNLVTGEGLRSLPLNQVQRLRFLNAALDSDLRRALEVLASRHDSQKKVVSLTFRGEGKRPVKVGYVIENPIWKTSYRLVLEEKGQAFLQGWAVVENTSDDDWKDVRLALVSGRPISYQMNLYQPLFIPRPTVEPERFASLRPPTFSGALINPAQAAGAPGGGGPGAQAGTGNTMFLNTAPANTANPFNRYNLNQGGQVLMGYIPSPGQAANPGANASAGQNLNVNFDNNGLFLNNGRLTFEELQNRQRQQAAARQQAKNLGSTLSALNLKDGVTSVASAEEVGDYFQYVIDHKVNLPRQKSALLPIVSNNVEANRVSIYNESVQPKFPLLGLKFKNTSGQNLMQGPVTVYEGATYSGDARIMDLQPGEERLLAYAIDQGTEVKVEGQSAPVKLEGIKVVKGQLLVTNKLRETKNYLIKNRSPQDRLLIVEHPVRPEWKLVTPEKASERSREVYRFEVKVAAGKALTFQVTEEMARMDRMVLSSVEEKTVRLFVASPVASPQLKEALQKTVAMRLKLSDTQRDLAQVQGQLKAITEDQTRLRANFERLPPTSAAYKRYLEKFDTQETEIEKLQGLVKQYQETEKVQQKALEDYLAGLTVE